MSRFTERRISPFIRVQTKNNSDSGSHETEISGNEVTPGAYLISRQSLNPRLDNQWDPTEQQRAAPTADDNFGGIHANNNDVMIHDNDNGSVSHGLRNEVYDQNESFNNEDSVGTSRAGCISFDHDTELFKTPWSWKSGKGALGVSLLVSLLIVCTVAVTVIFYIENKRSSRRNKSPLLQKCGIHDQETLLDVEFNPLLQCEYCGGQVLLTSDEVTDLYYLLRESGSFHDILDNSTMITSCDPENIALLWVVQDLLAGKPTVNQALEPSHRTLTRFILVFLYESLSGRAWKDATNWLTNESECNWFGITCNHDAIVTSLSLPNNNLKGSLNNSIGMLSDLSALDLGKNLISGSIPSAVLSLPFLENLRLDSNQLTGTIPADSRAHTSVLKHLVLGENSMLMGTLPILPEWIQLVEIEVDSTSLTGTIPSSLGVLTALKKLFISSTAISGTIPTSIGSLTLLEYFESSSAKLSGMIPSTIGHLANLKSFDVSGNSLHGSLPSEIGQCSKLQSFLVAINQLTGTVPSEVAMCEELEHINLKQNSLIGTLPLELERLSNLEDLLMSCTAITAPIPVGLCNQSTKIQVAGKHQDDPSCFCCDDVTSQFENEGVLCSSP